MRSSWTGATIAPTSIDLSSGSPTLSFSIRARSLAYMRSAIASAIPLPAAAPVQESTPDVDERELDAWPDFEDPAPVDAPADSPDSGATVACADYRAHQSRHRLTADGWTCDACRPEWSA